MTYPDWLDKVVEKTQKQYKKGERTDYSSTELLTPPLIWKLEKDRPPPKTTHDALSSFIGNATHNEIERNLKPLKRYVVEERLYREIYVPDAPGEKKTFTISGQIDLYDTKTKRLGDHKVTGSFKIVKGDYMDWAKQLNTNRWLALEAGYEVDSLAINAFIRDWQISKAETHRDYPKSQFQEIEIDVWSIASTEAYIRSAIKDLEWGRLGQPRICSDSERWPSGSDVWAVMKKGRKSAIRLLDHEPTQEEIESLGGEYVEYRPPFYRRCNSYCASSDICPVFQNGT